MPMQESLCPNPQTLKCWLCILPFHLRSSPWRAKWSKRKFWSPGRKSFESWICSNACHISLILPNLPQLSLLLGMMVTNIKSCRRSKYDITDETYSTVPYTKAHSTVFFPCPFLEQSISSSSLSWFTLYPNVHIH